MMIEEFFKRTGVMPLKDEYEKIEEAYYRFDGDKDEFCKRWLDSGGFNDLVEDRKQEIISLRENIVSLKKQVMSYEDNIQNLKDQLEKELDWKLSEKSGTKMAEERYQELRANGKELSNDEAKELIHKEFGFDVNEILILDYVETYEVNRHHKLRVKDVLSDRRPVYAASDWNYVPFEVRGWQYEMINSSLYPYS